MSPWWLLLILPPVCILSVVAGIWLHHIVALEIISRPKRKSEPESEFVDDDPSLDEEDDEPYLGPLSGECWEEQWAGGPPPPWEAPPWETLREAGPEPVPPPAEGVVVDIRSRRKRPPPDTAS